MHLFTKLKEGEFLEISLPKDFLGKLSSQDNTTTFELRMPFVIQEVLEGSLNKTYDLQKGDIITSINDKKINYVDELIQFYQKIVIQLLM